MLGINSFCQFVVAIILLVERNDIKQSLRAVLKICAKSYVKLSWCNTFSVKYFLLYGCRISFFKNIFVFLYIFFFVCMCVYLFYLRLSFYSYSRIMWWFGIQKFRKKKNPESKQEFRAKTEVNKDKTKLLHGRLPSKKPITLYFIIASIKSNYKGIVCWLLSIFTPDSHI